MRYLRQVLPTYDQLRCGLLEYLGQIYRSVKEKIYRYLKSTDDENVDCDLSTA